MIKKILTAVLSLLVFSHAHAATITSGSTTLGLDENVLAGLGLTVTSLSSTGTATTTGLASGLTIVSFEVNSSAVPLEYNPATFPDPSSFVGMIDHLGVVSMSFDPDGGGSFPAIDFDLGDMTIAFDSSRVTDVNSGFYVQDNLSIRIALFDLGFLSTATSGTSATQIIATSTSLTLGPANLLVSPELNAYIQNFTGNVDTILTGRDVGDLRIDTIPEPTTLSAALLGLGLLGRRRRRA
jgi:hypothetical protein